MIAFSVVVVGLVAVATLVLIGWLGAFATRVEADPGPLPERVHRLRRASRGWALATLLVGSVGGLYAQAGLTDGHHTAGRTVAGYLCWIGCTVGPPWAVIGTLRGPISRLREIPVRNPGGLRRLAAVLPLLVVLYGTVAAGVALGPRHGFGSALALFASYLVAFLLVQVVSPVSSLIVGARPLPAPLETRLQALAARQGVRRPQFRVLPDRSRKLANAAQIGIVPGLRYVVLTEYLVANMTDDELDAVAAHELGHARGQHLLVKMGAVLVTWAAAGGLLTALLHSGGLAAVIGLLALPLAVFVVGQAVGLRLEERADDAAARAVGAGHLSAALGKLGQLNHTPRATGRLWNLFNGHPGLYARIARLEATSGSGAAAREGFVPLPARGAVVPSELVAELLDEGE